MRYLNNRAVVVVLTLALTPVLAASQNAELSVQLPSGQSLSGRLPLEQYAASLGIGTPAGALLRQELPRLALVRVPERRAIESRSLPSPSPAPIRECPMPVMRPDTVATDRMPVMKLPSNAPTAGVIRGCENPLAAMRE